MSVNKSGAEKQSKDLREIRKLTWGVFAGIDSPMVSENMSNSPKPGAKDFSNPY
jgi:hypothetical protein